LLEAGLLQPGQLLVFGPTAVETATVLADGRLHWREQTGSIHQIARAIRQAPCNG
jgi:hypothetical protein